MRYSPLFSSYPPFVGYVKSLSVAENPGASRHRPGMDEKLKGKLPETLTLKLNRPRQVKVAFKKTGAAVRRCHGERWVGTRTVNCSWVFNPPWNIL
jgi:hypothetical protein